ncbi:epl1 protein [Obba rivulosa]|uniref:Epl1 protein n=1 Tax=Obba rivulosa TaxID=1052685 RepID=A0A8E2DIH5_9APHY|nr:epl1 protein [Obba rivulosa]
MQSKRSVFAALAALSGVFAQPSTTVSVSFDQTYDNKTESLDVVACSHTIEQLGFTTFQSVPNFPNIGGAGVVTGFDSSGCGTCWELTFGDTSISLFVIDSSAPGTFNIALEAMDTLTNGQAEFFGRVNATATQVGTNACSLDT